MQYLECQGTSRQIGRAHGETFRELIRQRWADDVVPWILRVEATDAANHGRMQAILADTRGYLARRAPDLLEEMDGIAEGAGLSCQDALMLSTYNALERPQQIQPPAPDGCTAIAITRTPAGPLLFKTYDPFGSPQIDSPERWAAKIETENRICFVARTRYQEDGQPRTLLGVRLAGSVWTEAAVSDTGLAFAATSLHPRLSPMTAGAFPQHLIGTLAMKRCRTVADVRTFFPSVPVFGKGYAQTYVDRTGDAVGVEKTAGYTGFNEAQDGAAFQTNHIRSASLLALAREQDPAFFQSSYHTNSSNRAKRLAASAPRWSAMDLNALLADLYHTGACGDPVQNCTEQCQYWITTWSALVFPASGELRVTRGRPQAMEFDVYRLQ